MAVEGRDASAVRFGIVTPEKLLLIVVLLQKLQKWAYLADYLRTCSTGLDHIFSFIDLWVGMISLSFVLRSFKGRCYGNQLIWGLFANVEIDRVLFLLSTGLDHILIIIIICSGPKRNAVGLSPSA